jgi:hypothetical protein
MFLVPSIALLLTFIYMRPHEVFEVLRPLDINLIAALVLFSFVLDVRSGAVRLRGSWLLFGMLGLFGWFVVTIAFRAPDRLGDPMVRLLVAATAFIAISEGVQTLRGLGVIAGLLVGLTLIISVVGVYQSFTPPVCHLLQGESSSGTVLDVADGRPCEKRAECFAGGLPDRDYACEHPGLLGTHSIGLRVRFRGLLEDPNELAWALSMGMPLAFGLWERRRTTFRFLLFIAVVVASFVCVVKTQSRSGQLSMIAVMGVYFVRRFGWKGASLGVIAAIPLLIFGGRSGEEAESSSGERLECWAEALSMWRENPITGVGGGQFLEHHHLTAHSSFMLTLAELGPLGLVLWSVILYLAFKIVLLVNIRFAGRPEAAAARTWATAFLAALVGLVVSAFFLTLAYHPILWAFLGLAGALYSTVRAHEPSFRVRFGWRDFGYVVAGDVVLVSATALYLRIKGV